MSALLVLSTLAAATTPAPRAEAQPSVTVTAESRIDLAVVRDVEGNARVEGVLRDDLGRGLPEQEITLNVAGHPPLALVTDGRGRFDAALPASMAAFQVSATYGGQALYAPTEVHREADLSRNDVRLGLTLDPERDAPVDGPDPATHIDLDAPTTDIRVRAVELGVAGQIPAAGLRVSLLSDTQVPLGQGTTDADGELTVSVPNTRFGSVGRGRILARSPQGERRAASTTDLVVVRYRATELQAVATPVDASEDEQITVTGTLTDSQGPLRGAHVGLYGLNLSGTDGTQSAQNDGPAASETHLATAIVDEGGAFGMTVQVTGHTPTRTWVVRFRSGEPGVLSSESAPLRIRVKPRSASWPWLLVPLLLLGVALVLARRRPASDAAMANSGNTQAGIFVPKGSARKRHPKRVEISGVVVHHATGEPIVGARVSVAGQETSSGPEGRFVLTPDASAATLRVVAPGYVEQSSEITVPHRGEWTNITVRLESLRDRALTAFRNVALRILPSATSWSLTTNREVPAAVSSHQRPAIEALAIETDALYYGPVAPEPGQIASLAERAGAIDDDPTVT